ncbi:hypothetical protein J1614_010197 [Plenodomus biglobosus]|nr:hypothetical protein J1614_010197 [Plenodomus biglobosus]
MGRGVRKRVTNAQPSAVLIHVHGNWLRETDAILVELEETPKSPNYLEVTCMAKPRPRWAQCPARQSRHYVTPHLLRAEPPTCNAHHGQRVLTQYSTYIQQQLQGLTNVPIAGEFHTVTLVNAQRSAHAMLQERM